MNNTDPHVNLCLTAVCQITTTNPSRKCTTSTIKNKTAIPVQLDKTGHESKVKGSQRRFAELSWVINLTGDPSGENTTHTRKDSFETERNFLQPMSYGVTSATAQSQTRDHPPFLYVICGEIGLPHFSSSCTHHR
jgi:hypothetical protein